jgi:hypothetical protein
VLSVVEKIMEIIKAKFLIFPYISVKQKNKKKQQKKNI